MNDASDAAPIPLIAATHTAESASALLGGQLLGAALQTLGLDPASFPAESWDAAVQQLTSGVVSAVQAVAAMQPALGSGALYPHEIDAIQQAGLDPAEYAGFDMPAAAMQISHPPGAPAPLLDTRVILQPQVARLPLSRLVLAGGGPALPKNFIAPRVPVLVRVVMLKSARPDAA